MTENNFKLDCAFLHSKMVIGLLNQVENSILQSKIEYVNKADTGNLRFAFINSLLTDAVLGIIKKNKVESLEAKLLKNQVLNIGELVWIEQGIYFKGTIKAATNYFKGRVTNAEFHFSLEEYDNLIVKGVFSPEHLFGDSSVSRLSGKSKVFMLAYINEITPNELILRPIFIGGRMIDTGTPFGMLTESLLVNIEDIDEFKEATKVNRRKLSLDVLKDIPEKQVKTWFAEILQEENVPIDWGGENSDLFTNHIHVNGHRLNAAFLLKGMAKFHRMTHKDLGKNGDQIVRLYQEPASLFILQHCHTIDPSLYKTMRAFSSDFNRITKYCIIDGYDTLRILKAYDKIR